MPSPTVDAVMAHERAAAFTKRSIKTQSKLAALTLALSMMDLTTLEGKDSPEKVRGLCRKAIRPFERDIDVLGAALPSAAAVCVYPALIKDCVRELRSPGGPALRAGSSSVLIASVATGFPSGQFPLDVRLSDVRAAVADGADEIDMVINRGAFLAGRYDEVAQEIRATKLACKRDDGSFAGLKVILETGELETLDNVRRASDLAIDALLSVASSAPGGPALRAGSSSPRSPSAPAEGVAESARPGEASSRNGHHSLNGDAHHTDSPRPSLPDFIKTSTGKVTPAATMPVTLVMLEALRDAYLRTGAVIGMKPAGGIRTAKQAVHYLVMVHETMGPLNVPSFEAAAGNPWLTPAYFRFGASALCNDLLRQIVRLKTGRYAAAYDFSEA